MSPQGTRPTEIRGAQAVKVIDADIRALPDDFDVLVNNAGVGAFCDVIHTVEGIMRRAFEVNVMLPFKTIKLVLPHMMARKWGRIVNISSTNSLQAVEKMVPYNMAKSALNGLTRTVAREYAAYGIACNAVCPGGIEGGYGYCGGRILRRRYR